MLRRYRVMGENKAENEKALDDAIKFGTGVLVNGKHVPLKDVILLSEGDIPNSTADPSPTLSVDEGMIEEMVNKFLTWELPEDFTPDAGISFEPNYNQHTAYPMRHKPTGTNLFDAEQATAMIRHIASVPALQSKPVLVEGGLIERLQSYIPKGDGYNDQFAHDLTAAVEALQTNAEQVATPQREKEDLRAAASALVEFRKGTEFSRLEMADAVIKEQLLYKNLDKVLKEQSK
jgi:hypothetical protein